MSKINATNKSSKFKAFIKTKDLSYKELATNPKMTGSTSSMGQAVDIKELDQDLQEVFQYLQDNYDSFPSGADRSGITSKVKNVIIRILYNYTIGQRHFNEQVKNAVFLLNQKISELDRREKKLSEIIKNPKSKTKR